MFRSLMLHCLEYTPKNMITTRYGYNMCCYKMQHSAAARFVRKCDNMLLQFALMCYFKIRLPFIKNATIATCYDNLSGAPNG